MGTWRVGGRRAFDVACYRCSWRAAGEVAYECPDCGSPVLLELALLSAPPSVDGGGVWARRDLLPVGTTEVTLGEGGTPVVELPSDWHPGGGRIVAKLESLNPTLSFKDRAMALGAALAVQLGQRGLVVASTGNAAVSASAYAAAAGLKCRVLVGADSRARGKLDACRTLGARVEEVAGDYSAAYALARGCEGDSWLNVSTTYRNPILAEAYRGLAFELLDQLGEVPEAVVVPVGAGPLLRGVERGFDDLRACGLGDRAPRMVAVQAAAVAPVRAAWLRRRGRADDPPSVDVTTIATAIADPLRGYADHAEITVDAVLRSGGTVVAVDDATTATATERLLRAGLWVEPSAATALAALSAAEVADLLSGERPVVLLLTGHGAKVRV
jgi:threonine synthase